MTTSVSTRAPGRLNPTRQQLDELDSLLQRMLELPVNTLDEEEELETEEAVMEPPLPPAPPPPLPPPVVSSREKKSAREPKPAPPPVSYTVVETASPRPIPLASGFEPRPSMLSPRLVPVTNSSEETESEGEPFAPQPAPPPVSETPVVPQSVPEMPVAPHSVAEMPFVAPTSENETDLWVPLRSTWQPSAQTWQPLAESWHQAQGGIPSPFGTPNPIPLPMPDPGLEPMPVSATQFSDPTPPPWPTSLEDEIPAAPPMPTKVEKEEEEKSESKVEAAVPPLRLTMEDAPPAAPLPLVPLVWFNQGFDALLSPLGSAGRWVCGPSGRQLLGLAGLASLAAAAILAVSAGMGWSW